MISLDQTFLLYVAVSGIVLQHVSSFALHGNTRAGFPPLSSTSGSCLSAAVLEDTAETKISSQTSSTSNTDNLHTPKTSELMESTPKAEPKNDWDFVEKTYLITCPNADPNSERLNKAKGILEKVGLLDQVQVKEFATDDEDRIRGCYTSHISVLKDGLRDIQSTRNNGKDADDWWGSLFSIFDKRDSNSNSDNEESNDRVQPKSTRPKCILVLEDNLEFSGSLKNEIFKSISDFLESDKEADMLHLSYIPYVPNFTVTKTDMKNIVGLTTGQSSALGTTAYVITEKAIEALLEEDAKNGFRAPIPDVMAEQFPESRFSVYPTPFLRAPNTKSLVNPQLDDLRELLFLPPVVSQFQNVLAQTGLTTNTIFFATIGTLVIAGANAGMEVVNAVNQFISTGSYDGNVFLLLINAIFTTFSLGIIAQGAALAPKPPEEAPEDEKE